MKLIALSVTVLSVFVLTACGLGTGTPEPSPARTSRQPSAADLAELQRRIEALDGVSHAALSFSPATREVEASWTARIDATQADRAGLAQLLDASYRTLWQDTDVPVGLLTFVVRNPAGVEAGYADLKLRTLPGYNQLLERYGPRPG